MTGSEHIAAVIDPALATTAKRLAAVGEDVRRLRLPLRTLLLVNAAQGISDSGGFRYLFENDFPHQPPYSLFMNAYQRIWSRLAAYVVEHGVVLGTRSSDRSTSRTRVAGAGP